MQEVSGPVVAIALILSSVFLPVAFMGGIQGRLNNQYAVTIVVSMLISAFNALTLSPALAAPCCGRATPHAVSWAASSAASTGGLST
jgi:multidrug efflux pump subunit AcrB